MNQGRADDGGTALMETSEGGHEAVVRRLLGSGADVTIQSTAV